MIEPRPRIMEVFHETVCHMEENVTFDQRWKHPKCPFVFVITAYVFKKFTEEALPMLTAEVEVLSAPGSMFSGIPIKVYVSDAHAWRAASEYAQGGRQVGLILIGDDDA